VRSDALDVPEPVRRIAERLEEAGYETWAVGGAVRDALLGAVRSDWDLATAAHPDTVQSLFRPSYPIGLRFGTVGVRGSDGRIYEVTTFRKDIETDGRHAVVEYADSIDEDLARRDFTINAIAYHPLDGRFRDPFCGGDDLRDRRLRCVGEPAVRFAEDYLRVLRGLRFAGRYELEIVPDSWRALTEAVPKIVYLSGERIREELLKVLAGPRASSTLTLYQKSGARDVMFPELVGLDEIEWERTLRTIEVLPPQRLHLRLVVLLLPLAPRLEEVMTRLRFSNAELRDVEELCAALRHPLPERAEVARARRWLRKVSPSRARDVLRLHIAFARAADAEPAQRAELGGRVRGVLEVLRRGDPVTLKDLAIDGNDLMELGFEPGPPLGRVLEDCLEAVIDDPELNRRERLLEMVEERRRHGTGGS
jgi:tRNA nucleotidyltransferase (CCA-adding enzyme)